MAISITDRGLAPVSYNSWLQSQGIVGSGTQYSPEVQNALQDSYSNLSTQYYGGDAKAFGDIGGMPGQGTDSLFGNLTSKDLANYGGLALGAGQLGLGVASFLENQQTAGKQRELLGQQIASNKQEMAHRAAARDALNTAFTQNR